MKIISRNLNKNVQEFGFRSQMGGEREAKTKRWKKHNREIEKKWEKYLKGAVEKAY